MEFGVKEMTTTPKVVVTTEERAEIVKKFARHVAPATATSYAGALIKLCTSAQFNRHPFEILNGEKFTMDDARLEKIEYATEDFILDHVNKLAPKYLNVIYNAIKSWLFVNRMIKTRRIFRELKFDKTSLKESALMSQNVTTPDMKTMFSLADGTDALSIGAYGLQGLRPSLIPYLRVTNIHPRSYTITDGRIELTRPCMIVIRSKYIDTDEQYNPKFKKGEWVQGNKAHIDFISFVPTRITELLEHFVNKPQFDNNGDPIPIEHRKLNPADNKRDVRYIIKKYFREIDKGDMNPYRLRNYANFLFGKIKDKDDDLKEQLMGHKGKISAVYQFRGLSDEQEKEYRMIYSIIDTYIDENVFGSLTETDRKIADTLDTMAHTLGVDVDQVAAIRAILEQGKMSLDQYRGRLESVIQKVSSERLQGMVNSAVSKAIQRQLEENPDLLDHPDNQDERHEDETQ